MKTIIMITLLAISVMSVNPTHADAAQPWQIGFQDPATPVMEGVINFHNDLMIVVIGVGVFVGYVMWSTVYNFEQSVNPTPNRVQHGTRL